MSTKKKFPKSGSNICPQIVTWTYYFQMISAFGLLGFPSISNLAIQLSLTGAFLITSSLTLITLALIKRSKPYPPNYFKALKKEAIDWNDTKTDYLCSLCKIPVDQDTKHCNTCDKCIFQFDHHCIWINQCIGARNNNLFLYFVSLLLVSGALCIVGLIYALRDKTQKKIKGWIITVVVINCCVVLFLLQLLVFHFYLRATGSTTYKCLFQKKMEKNLERMKKDKNGKEKEEDIESTTKNQTNLDENDDIGETHRKLKDKKVIEKVILNSPRKKKNSNKRKNQNQELHYFKKIIREKKIHTRSDQKLKKSRGRRHPSSKLAKLPNLEDKFKSLRTNQITPMDLSPNLQNRVCKKNQIKPIP